MEEKIFLEKNKSVSSNNIENSINVELENDTRLSKNENLSEIISLFEQYNEERDKCNKFRIIVNVNPICSNIIHNIKTEIVKNEGGENCKILYDGATLYKNEEAPSALTGYNLITYLQAIRDTEYSNKKMGDFVYHCGIDIFNNHMLRKNGFMHVNGYNDDENIENFNTISDYLRDARGEIVEDELGRDPNLNTKTKMHLYEYDTILSMTDAFSNRCEEKEGWWGFTNPGTLEIPNSLENKDLSVNRMMGNNKPCEFIDLYPDRSLYTFTPKYNKYRKRLEKNWDYCLTYPYENDFEMINVVCDGGEGAIRANVKDTYITSDFLECNSYFKHNLSVGDYVNFYYYYDFGDTKELEKFESKVKVTSVGDANGNYKDRIFSVKISDISLIYDYLISDGCFYKKVSNGEECSYYFRKFKKLKTLSDEELNSSVNKIAFAQSIYGDEQSQIIFTDDVDLSSLYNNIGRPVSEIYLTIIKRNAGHDSWYTKKTNPNFNDEECEFSHCFGKVTSGLDFSGIINEPFDYNVHYLHNLDVKPQGLDPYNSWSKTLSAWGDTILNGVPEIIEDDITIEDYDMFYGDIVELDHSTGKETSISDVYHRFNTAQRETSNYDYKNIFQDVIVYDDYDVPTMSSEYPYNTFTVNTYYMNHSAITNASITASDVENGLIYGNVAPEGYYYKPHYKLALKEDDTNVSYSDAKIINYEDFSWEVIGSQYAITISFTNDYDIYKGEFIAFYNKNTRNIAWGEVVSSKNKVLTIYVNREDIEFENGYSLTDIMSNKSILRTYYVFWSPDNVPTYATLSLNRMKFSWIKILSPSQLNSNNSLYNMTFANGRFYSENNINFFLRRQDPFGKYGLSKPLFLKTMPSVINQMQDFIIQDKKIDLSKTFYLVDNITNTCY